MTERLAEQIRRLAEKHTDLPAARAFIKRLQEEDGLTRDENPYTHYCVYFAAYDPAAGKLFVGHHIKSDLWLFNGGHIDAGETIEETLLREMGEEWGLEMALDSIVEPKLLTITEISNAAKQSCTRHYDIWYFVPIDRDTFAPDQALLAKEYHFMKWLNPGEARKRITDSNTLQAVALLEEIFEQSHALNERAGSRLDENHPDMMADQDIDN